MRLTKLFKERVDSKYVIEAERLLKSVETQVVDLGILANIDDDVEDFNESRSYFNNAMEEFTPSVKIYHYGVPVKTKL